MKMTCKLYKLYYEIGLISLKAYKFVSHTCNRIQTLTQFSRNVENVEDGWKSGGLRGGMKGGMWGREY